MATRGVRMADGIWKLVFKQVRGCSKDALLSKFLCIEAALISGFVCTDMEIVAGTAGTPVEP